MSQESYQWDIRWIWLFTIVAISACSVQSSPANINGTATSSNLRQTLANSDGIATLDKILERRMHDGFSSGSDFALGPGDLLEISVPLEGLKQREVRVSSQSTITLPLVGALSVKGMTEEQLTQVLRDRLSKYMYNPPVVLFVKHYANRDVAVTGAVEKPGLYVLQSGSDTLNDMISRAGGPNAEAGSQVFFAPATSIPSAATLALLNRSASDTDKHTAATDTHIRPQISEPLRVSAITPDPPGPADSLNPTPALEAVGIDTKNPRMLAYLNIPARPGDMLIIPSAGEVTVGGWVQAPGAYKITPGLTALSAISAAGGPLFSSSGEILRTGSDGERISIPFDISQIQNGQQTDQSVKAGDVVMVQRSVVGAVPYSLYEIFSKFGTGMYLPVP